MRSILNIACVEFTTEAFLFAAHPPPNFTFQHAMKMEIFQTNVLSISQLRQTSGTVPKVKHLIREESEEEFQLCKSSNILTRDLFWVHAKLPNWIFSIYLHNSPQSEKSSFTRRFVESKLSAAASTKGIN